MKFSNINPSCCEDCPCYEELDYSYHTGGKIWKHCKAGNFDIEVDPTQMRSTICPDEDLKERDQHE